MAAVVTDTHALVWYFLDQGRLFRNVLDAFDQAAAARDPIWLPTIAIVEICYLVDKLRQIPREIVPDKPDRIIAATALHLSLPLITRDSQIQSSQITTIW